MTEVVSAVHRLVRWIEQDSLPLWAEAGVDHERGGFQEAIGQDGAPAEAARRARVQARQIYVYSTAVTYGWGGARRQPAWRAAVSEGLEYLSAKYRRRDGLYRTLVSADGSVEDDTALLYDQAFVMFALAAAFSIQPKRTDLLRQARDLLRCTMRSFAKPGGGLREASAERPYQSNPHMHLFEAALAWSELDPNGPWPTLADTLAELCLTRFIDRRTGALREVFSIDWSAAAGLDGRIVEPGHQFEWCWLLARWGRLRGRRDALSAAERLFDIATVYGVDPQRGVACNALLDDFTCHDSSARLWPQTERVKAALVLSEVGRPERRDERRAQVAAAIDGLKPYLHTPIKGLWWDKLDASGAFLEEPASASSFYHIACAVAELDAYVARATDAKQVGARVSVGAA